MPAISCCMSSCSVWWPPLNIFSAVCSLGTDVPLKLGGGPASQACFPRRMFDQLGPAGHFLEVSGCILELRAWRRASSSGKGNHTGAEGVLRGNGGGSEQGVSGRSPALPRAACVRLQGMALVGHTGDVHVGMK